MIMTLKWLKGRFYVVNYYKPLLSRWKFHCSLNSDTGDIWQAAVASCIKALVHFRCICCGAATIICAAHLLRVAAAAERIFFTRKKLNINEGKITLTNMYVRWRPVQQTTAAWRPPRGVVVLRAYYKNYGLISDESSVNC